MVVLETISHSLSQILVLASALHRHLYSQQVQPQQVEPTLDNTELSGVSGIIATHAPGSTISFGSTVQYLDVEDTSDFPARLGVNGFAGQNTAGLIEAKTTDAQGNEFDMQYVFSYTKKPLLNFKALNTEQ